MARRKHKGPPHGLDWHEMHLAEPWLNFSHHATEGRPARPFTRREYERGMEGKRQQMEMHDAQPKRMRELVGEHNINKALELYRQEVMATVQRCPHGRKHAPSCAQCTYDRAQAERAARGRETSGGLSVGRDGEQLIRASATSAADIIERARKRGLDV